MSREEITAEYSFDQRQTNYYGDAGRYLGLVEKVRTGNESIYVLSVQGQHVMKLAYKERQLAITAQILQHEVFRKALQTYFQRDALPDTQTVVSLMKASELYRVEAESTYVRRASTVIGWLKWMVDLLDT